MVTGDKYKTIETVSQGVFKERGSRFIADAYPVSDIEEVKVKVDLTKKEYHDARHHCFAYMIGHERNIWRTNDDGEPSGTAGRPILGQINSYGLTNILIIVTRYFGGTLLGVSGLINAYRSAALEAIKNARIVERTVNEYYDIRYSYSDMNIVMKIIKEEGIIIESQTFENECCLRLFFPCSAKERILGRLLRIENLSASYLRTC
jgi:uncharacterized YigZ family protein